MEICAAIPFVFLRLQLLVTLEGNTTHREGRLSQAIEKFTETRMLQIFFATGKLASPAVVQPCNDEEYIGQSVLFSSDRWFAPTNEMKTCRAYNYFSKVDIVDVNMGNICAAATFVRGLRVFVPTELLAFILISNIFSCPVHQSDCRSRLRICTRTGTLCCWESFGGTCLCSPLYERER